MGWKLPEKQVATVWRCTDGRRYFTRGGACNHEARLWAKRKFKEELEEVIEMLAEDAPGQRWAESFWKKFYGFQNRVSRLMMEKVQK